MGVFQQSVHQRAVIWGAFWMRFLAGMHSSSVVKQTPPDQQGLVYKYGMCLFSVRCREAAFSWKCPLWFACTLFSHSTTCGTRPGKNGTKRKKIKTNKPTQPLRNIHTKFQRPSGSTFIQKETRISLEHRSALCH